MLWDGLESLCSNISNVTNTALSLVLVTHVHITIVCIFVGASKILIYFILIPHLLTLSPQLALTPCMPPAYNMPTPCIPPLRNQCKWHKAFTARPEGGPRH